MAFVVSFSSDSQNRSAHSYPTYLEGSDEVQSHFSEKSDSSEDNRPLRRLRHAGEPSEVAPESMVPPTSIDRGSPSPAVQGSVCTLKAADLPRLCKIFNVDRSIFFLILPLPRQTAYDPPVGYEAIYEEYFKSGLTFLFQHLYYIS